MLLDLWHCPGPPWPSGPLSCPLRAEGECTGSRCPGWAGTREGRGPMGQAWAPRRGGPRWAEQLFLSPPSRPAQHEAGPGQQGPGQVRGLGALWRWESSWGPAALSCAAGPEDSEAMPTPGGQHPRASGRATAQQATRGSRPGPMQPLQSPGVAPPCAACSSWWTLRCHHQGRVRPMTTAALVPEVDARHHAPAQGLTGPAGRAQNS